MIMITNKNNHFLYRYTNKVNHSFIVVGAKPNKPVIRAKANPRIKIS